MFPAAMLRSLEELSRASRFKILLMYSAGTFTAEFLANEFLANAISILLGVCVRVVATISD